MNAIENAVTEELFEQALREADAADQELNAAHEVHAQNTMVILLFFNSIYKYNLLALPVRAGNYGYYSNMLVALILIDIFDIYEYNNLQCYIRLWNHVIVHSQDTLVIVPLFRNAGYVGGSLTEAFSGSAPHCERPLRDGRHSRHTRSLLSARHTLLVRLDCFP